MQRGRVSLIVWSVAGLLAGVGGLAELARADSAASTDQALELSKKTGRPVFAVAGGES